MVVLELRRVGAGPSRKVGRRAAFDSLDGRVIQGLMDGDAVPGIRIQHLEEDHHQLDAWVPVRLGDRATLGVAVLIDGTPRIRTHELSPAFDKDLVVHVVFGGHLPGEWHAAGHLQGDHGTAPDIDLARVVVDRVVHFRRRVARGSDPSPSRAQDELGGLGGFEFLTEAEIGESENAVAPQEQVPRFDVEMGDALTVKAGDATQELLEEA